MMRARLTSPDLWMVVAMVAVFAAGLIVATATPGPLLTADDLASFGLAWTMAGEGAAPMPPQAPYGLLYPATLVPGWLLGFDDGAMLLWARTVNALCGALMVPVLTAFLQRLDGVRPVPAIAAATAGAMMPAFLLTGSIAWSERLSVLLVACAALVTARSWDERSGLDGFLAVVTAAAMFAAHPRLGPPAVALIVVVAVALRRLGWARVVGLLGAGVAALWLVEWVRAAVAVAAFGSDGTYDAADLASRRGLGLVPEMAQLGVGALSYLVIAGTGIAVWGVVRLGEHRPVGAPRAERHPRQRYRCRRSRDSSTRQPRAAPSQGQARDLDERPDRQRHRFHHFRTPPQPQRPEPTQPTTAPPPPHPAAQRHVPNRADARQRRRPR